MKFSFDIHTSLGSRSPTKIGNLQTNRHFEKTIRYYLEKYNFFDVHLLGLICRPKCHGFAQFFLSKLIQSFLRYFEKNAKKTLFSCTITILVHTLYDKVKMYELKSDCIKESMNQELLKI